jgi:hypothetical protein
MQKLSLRKNRVSFFFFNNIFYIYIYKRIFFAQAIFEIKQQGFFSYRFLKKFWIFYVLKVLFHFGLLLPSHPIFFKLNFSV